MNNWFIRHRTAFSFLLLTFIFLSLLVPSISSKDISEELTTSIPSEAGQLDLQSTTSADNSQMSPLHGQWEFYWMELLTPEEIDPSHAAYIQVPSSWKNQAWNKDNESQFGYGTYRLQVELSPEDIGESKAIYVESIGSAYRVWINGQEKPGLGVVGKSRAEETPQMHINLIFVEPKQQSMEIVIQASNYSFRESGIFREIVYGDAKTLIVYLLKEMFYDIFIIGGFALIGLFHLIIYAFRRKNTLTLYVGLVTMAVSARALILNEYLTSLVLGITGWELLTKIEYVIENLGFLMIVLLMKHMYPQEAHRYMVYVSYLIAVLLSLYVVIMPARIFTETMVLQSAVKLVVLLYFVLYVGIVAFMKRREGAMINIAAMLILVAVAVNDVLYYGSIVNTVELISLGATSFVLAQAIIVSYRYSRLAHKNDELVVELGDMNATLEEKVEVRTQKLHELNEQLSEMKEIRTKMLVNIAHDLNSPLTGVQAYLHLMDNGLFPTDRQDITRQLVEKTNYIQRLIQDLFELSKLESKEQALNLESVMAREWLSESYNQFAKELKQQSFTLHQGKWNTKLEGKEVYVRIDKFRMLQVLHNYMNNAMKFSRHKSNEIILNGYVTEGNEQDQAMLVVEIVDHGEGIPQAQLTQVFRRFYKKREGNESGSGLGLAIVTEIIEQHQGSVGVKSEEGIGSTFMFILPVESNERDFISSVDINAKG